MELSDIKIGQNYKKLKELGRKLDRFTFSPLPSFCNSKWLCVTDWETEQKKYILVKDGVIVDETTDCQKLMILMKQKKH